MYGHRKRSTYLSADAIKEIEAEAKRRGVSVSRIVQDAWRIARDTVRRFPGNIDPYSDVP